MAKNPKIRWRAKDADLLSKEIRNFNARLRYQKKNSTDNAILPDTVFKKDIENQIETRADFNKFIKHLQKFNADTAKKTVNTNRGGIVSQWEFDFWQMKEGIREKRKAEKRQELENKPAKQGGKELGYPVKMRMGDVREETLKPSTADPMNKSQTEIEKRIKMIDKALDKRELEKLNSRMRQNYIEALREHNFLNAAPELEDMINSLPFEKFFEVTQTDEYGEFGFIYTQSEFNNVLNGIKSTWQAAVDEYNNTK